jgi:hypothetical protein
LIRLLIDQASCNDRASRKTAGTPGPKPDHGDESVAHDIANIRSKTRHDRRQARYSGVSSPHIHNQAVTRGWGYGVFLPYGIIR